MKKDAKEAKTETERASGPTVYCGPTIPGVARQYTTYKDGVLPGLLTEAIKGKPVLESLVVPLKELPEVRRQFVAGAGRYYSLYCQALKI